MADSSNPSTAAWQMRMAELALSASCAEADEAADLLRELHELLSDGQAPQVAARGVAVQPRRFEALLAADACASAALLLIAGRASYMVSQGPGGRVMATVMLGGGTGEVSSEGADLALALTGALAEALGGALNAALNQTGQEERLVLRRPVGMRLN